ncbi:MAG: peptidyl-prolyl cis-trans isomerase SurA [Cyclobacteriaceae bacterium]|jgi:peptidyl-prolyl cis-trans isomerase SurA
MNKHSSVQKIFGLLIIFFVLSSSFTIIPNKGKEKFLFKLGDKEYFEEEFRYYFFKNNNSLAKDSVEFKIEEYLDLYIKFRLKVLAAETLGKDKEDEFKKEFNGYKSQLIKPYLMESKITESLVQETYDRMKEERLASHILLGLKEDALPADTLKVYNRLLAIKTNVENGASFDSLAFKYSEDPSAKSNKGSLGYFSALQMVYPFEEATFTTPVGQLAGPVRTKFGYHLIYVKDKRPALGKVQVAHIMIKNPSNGETNLTLPEKKIRSVYEKLLNGEDWESLCKLHSEDVRTKDRGGILNWFSTGKIVKEFEERAFGMEKIGDISEPFKTRFGWHVIQLKGKKGLESFDKVRPKLESSLSRDERSRVKTSKAIATIKSQNGFILSGENKKIALARIDSSLLMGNWQTDTTSADSDLTLFGLGEKEYTLRDFWSYTISRQRKRTHSNLQEYKTDLYNRFEEKSIFDFEEVQLSKTNFDYRMILEEYRSGILLFNLMEEKVWKKAMEDTLGQKSYYDRNKEEFIKQENAEVRIFVSSEENVIEQSRKYLEASTKEIDDVFNKQEALTLQVIEKNVEKGQDEMISAYWKEGVYKHVENEKYYLINIKKIIPEGIKKYEKTKGAVISGYQDELEKNWIEELKSQHPVKVNKSVLKKLISKIEEEV